jgi:hypothetical protein
LQYAEVARYAVQLRRVFDQVDRSRVQVVLFDDFAADVRAQFEKVLEFLELPAIENIEFTHVNQYKAHRWPAVSRLLMRPPGPLMQLKTSLKKRLGVHELGLSKLVYRSLSSQGKWDALTAETRSEIVGHLRTDVEDLQQLLGRDLSHWGFSKDAR